MKKIISILACVCLILSVMIVPVSAEETSATITFDDKAKRTTFDSAVQQIWEENGITVTNKKGAYANALGDYANPARFYAGTETIIEYPSMTKIEVTAGSAKYAQVWSTSNKDANATVTVSGSVATITFATAVDSYTVSMSAQSRVASITVYAELEAGACTHDSRSCEPNGDETHKVICDSCGETVSPAVECVDSDKDGACDSCTGAVALPFDPTGKTPAEIVDAAYELKEGKSFEKNATLTGVIISVDDEYSEQYSNITVTIAVEGKEDKPIKCFRLAGEGAENLEVDDIITVTGILTSYYGTIEFAQGCTLDAVEKPVYAGTDPEAPIELAVAEGMPVIPVEIKVPAEGTVFVKVADANGIFHVTSTTGAYMLINGMQNQVSAEDATDLTLCGYEMVNIYNPGTETITLYVFLEAGAGPAVGTWDNPEVLELMENPYMPNFPPSAQAQTALEAGNQGYFYKIVATDDGAFAVSISASDDEWNTLGYQFNVANNTAGVYSDAIVRAADADDYYDTLMFPVSAGDEIIINAGTFNHEDAWNAPAGNLYVQINFAPVGSYEYPVVLDEAGSYAAELGAASQGYYYEWVATADGKVTVTMNDETGWQYNVSKVPVDENDYANYYNSDTHWYDDETVVATETVVVKAGETIKVWVNTYDPENPWEAPAGTVNWTLGFEEINFGDADGDGEVGGKDVARLMQYLNEWDGITVDEVAADVNGDGKLNGRDVALLLQYLNGWDVKLG